MIMRHFDKAIEIVLRHEGGYVNNPHDPGGATNYGISLRFLKGLTGDSLPDAHKYGDLDGDGDIDADDIKLIDKGFAKDVYKRCWWDKWKYDRIDNFTIAAKLLDLAVNMGQRRAVVNLQRASRCVGHTLTEDGIMGENTFKAVNLLNPDYLIYAFASETAGYYRSLHKPEFERGWLNRAYSIDEFRRLISS